MTLERCIDILGRYVDNDLCAAEPGYVREVLTDVCDCNAEELQALGLDYLFDGEELE